LPQIEDLLCLHSNSVSMKLVWLRHLLVFVCVFSLMEGTGASVSSVFSLTDHHSEWQADNSDDDDAAERSEKETTLKEYYATPEYLQIAPLCISCEPIQYTHEQSNHHLAWVPPVPTPPPNSLV
jgi:hypothetical protein